MNRRIFLTTLTAALAPECLRAQSSAYDGPLFDAHLHLPLRRDTLPPTWVTWLKEQGLSGAIVHAHPSFLQPMTMLQRRFSDFYYPFAHVPIENQTLVWTDATLQTLQQQFDAMPVKGIAEMPLRHPIVRNPGKVPVDGPGPMRVFQLAAEKKVPVTVHVDYQYAAELDRAAAKNPATTFIWAHVGDGPPAMSQQMMQRNKNVYADISCRNPLFVRLGVREQSLADGNGKLRADWKSLFEQYPDRFLFGSDVGINFPERVAVLDKVVQFYRNVLGQLSAETAEKIGHKNAKALIGV